MYNMLYHFVIVFLTINGLFEEQSLAEVSDRDEIKLTQTHRFRYVFYTKQSRTRVYFFSLLSVIYYVVYLFIHSLLTNTFSSIFSNETEFTSGLHALPVLKY